MPIWIYLLFFFIGKEFRSSSLQLTGRNWLPWLQQAPVCHTFPSIEQKTVGDFNKPQQNILPDGLRIITTSLPGADIKGVFSVQNIITKGTRYGPYTGQTIHPDECVMQNSNALWEVSYTFIWVMTSSRNELRNSYIHLNTVANAWLLEVCSLILVYLVFAYCSHSSCCALEDFLNFQLTRKILHKQFPYFRLISRYFKTENWSITLMAATTVITGWSLWSAQDTKESKIWFWCRKGTTSTLKHQKIFSKEASYWSGMETDIWNIWGFPSRWRLGLQLSILRTITALVSMSTV